MEFYGNDLAHYAVAAIVVLLVYLVSKIISWLIETYAKHLAKRTKTRLDDKILEIIHRSVTFILVLSAIYFSVKSLTLPASVDTFTVRAVFVLFTLKIARELELFLRFFFESYLEPLAKRQKGMFKGFIPAINKLSKFIIWSLAFLLILGNLGYNITSLIAGLGIGGLALALAAQEMLGNAFGSLTLLTDQPFNIGDWIMVEGTEGEVMEIGMRSTKIKTMDRSTVSLPNSIVANSKIENYSRRNSRKVGQTFHFAYDTSVEKMQKMLKKVLEIVKKDGATEKDSARINFTDFGESALEVNLLYYITDMTSYARYLQIRERINLKIKSAAEKIGAEMAYPTQSLYIKNAKDLGKTTARRKARK